jgi:hypothetical protein
MLIIFYLVKIKAFILKFLISEIDKSETNKKQDIKKRREEDESNIMENSDKQMKG